ncbi:MAG: membrane protein [marine bacterium B5-7]|nr:MAG: membrane protein [marine bacterium B5-7]
MVRKWFRNILVLIILVGLATVLFLSFAPRPVQVDIGTVARGPMAISIEEEGRTRVHNIYTLATPVGGRLQRVKVEPGDPVVQGKTIVAQMLPNNPSALDIRTREQAMTEVAAAEAALKVSRANYEKVVADKELADADLSRTLQLKQKNTVSQATVDQAVREARAAGASLQTASAEISLRKAELANAQAHLIGMDDQGLAAAIGAKADQEIPLRAPTTGVILRVIQQSEITLSAGSPILEIGDIHSDLEVVVDLLSSDAVQVKVGDKVVLTKWGGGTSLSGIVDQVDPWGFTKVSALGVEEQRVTAVIRFTDSPEDRKTLGHGFRVEVRIVIWEDDDALIVPSSALFREGRNWAVFVVENDVAKIRSVDIGQNNGVEAQVQSGLKSGDQVVLYPSSSLSDGVMVVQREVQ